MRRLVGGRDRGQLGPHLRTTVSVRFLVSLLLNATLAGACNAGPKSGTVDKEPEAQPTLAQGEAPETLERRDPSNQRGSLTPEEAEELAELERYFAGDKERKAPAVIAQAEWLRLQLEVACLRHGAIDSEAPGQRSECTSRLGRGAIELSYTMLRAMPYDRGKDHAAIEMSACLVMKNVGLPRWAREIWLELDVVFPHSGRADRTRARAPVRDFAPEDANCRRRFDWSTPRIPYDAPAFDEIPLSTFPERDRKRREAAEP